MKILYTDTHTTFVLVSQKKKERKEIKRKEIFFLTKFTCNLIPVTWGDIRLRIPERKSCTPIHIRNCYWFAENKKEKKRQKE